MVGYGTELLYTPLHSNDSSLHLFCPTAVWLLTAVEQGSLTSPAITPSTVSGAYMQSGMYTLISVKIKPFKF